VKWGPVFEAVAAPREEQARKGQEAADPLRHSRPKHGYSQLLVLFVLLVVVWSPHVVVAVAALDIAVAVAVAIIAVVRDGEEGLRDANGEDNGGHGAEKLNAPGKPRSARHLFWVCAELWKVGKLDGLNREVQEYSDHREAGH